MAALKYGGNNMEALVIDRNSLPESISSYIESEQVEVSRKSGSVVLSPTDKKIDVEERIRRMEETTQKWHKMFSDGRMSTEDFIRQKAVEKALEEN
jgi:virulence-associated protein VagC